MKAIVQKVKEAEIIVEGRCIARCEKGLFVLIGLKKGDTIEDLNYIIKKVINLRVFEDENQKMNLSVGDVGGKVIVVSEFTLYGDTRRGNRPSFSEAMAVEEAREFWLDVEKAFLATRIPCEFGRFQAMMDCKITNEGPVTIIIDSMDRFRVRHD